MEDKLAITDLPDVIKKDEVKRFLCFKKWHENPNLKLQEIAESLSVGKSTVSNAISYGLAQKWSKLISN